MTSIEYNMRQDKKLYREPAADQELGQNGTGAVLTKMQKHDCGEEDVIFKDVVIVGNGPSGICLSYMLAGNWPYYTGEPHPGDDMLTARLHFSMRSTSVTDSRRDDNDEDGDGSNDYNDENDDDAIFAEKSGVQRSGSRKRKPRNEAGLARSTRRSLECLSSGLEGRTGGRPLSLLIDQLQNPCVDAGLDLPSLLTWRSAIDHPEHKIIDHVVLGKGPPGGAWQSMDPNVLTISLSRWMSLPGLDLRQWEMLVGAAQKSEGRLSNSHPSQERASSCRAASRVSVGTVAAYYKDYVRMQGLEEYFRCGTTVTSVKPVPDVEGEDVDYGWIIEGFENETGRRFHYRCRRVVLATGTTDSTNRLGLRGEETENWVTHDLNDLEARLDRLVDQQRKRSQSDDIEAFSEATVDPVLVVGAGLSAADAVIAARFRGIEVLHVFRDSSRDRGGKGAATENRVGIKVGPSGFGRVQFLPDSIYPEYHKVYEMMSDGGTNYRLYKALPGYTLVDLHYEEATEEKSVTLLTPDGERVSFRVSVAAILIGFKPDLSYLEENGVAFGRTPGKSVDNRSNPIETDDFTYEVTRAPRRGLYALGPLVGDNFVRFIVGGAFGVLTDIVGTLAM